MSILKKIQHRVGVALSPAEHYERAYSLGVLLGPTAFSSAAELFERAASRAARTGEAELQRRATANALLYQFLSGGPPQLLARLHEQLRSLDEIERVGSRVDRMRAATLGHEIAGRLAECTVAVTDQQAHEVCARLHESAARSFGELGTEPLSTYAHRPDNLPLDRADLRALFHEGLARFHEALAQARHDPVAAAERMSGALVALDQTPARAQRSAAEGWVERLRTQRSCWACGREFCGADIHFHSISATVYAHTREVVVRGGQDDASVDLSAQSVVLCTTCSSAISTLADLQAERRVAELRVEFERHVAELHRQIAALNGRIERLAALS